ncbi:SET domain-containing protein [Lewinella sp. W8]|uniref:SET domain-containing protein n=1 Tax=Lewinella sp. W8 TaxID=2528208 RepID=UPI0010682BD6|nr:SET domain-containing protein [Lewinella sp. W8]MTB52423.1 SET domain-containing protein-lysine N-methyltransferase [Lewinella sp. W8]
MIHPNTELKFISEQVGYGVFATLDIPEGTIVYVKDSLELVVSPTDYLMHSEDMKEVIEKYSYIDEKGDRIISWDFAKYVNHCCNCNSISTGYGFEIAIRDIKKGEQITDEYGIFNLDQPMSLVCGEPHCRKEIKPSDFDDYHQEWDEKIRRSIVKLFAVEQPLMPFIDVATREELDELFRNPKSYKSVYALKYQKMPIGNDTGKY